MARCPLPLGARSGSGSCRPSLQQTEDADSAAALASLGFVPSADASTGGSGDWHGDGPGGGEGGVADEELCGGDGEDDSDDGGDGGDGTGNGPEPAPFFDPDAPVTEQEVSAAVFAKFSDDYAAARERWMRAKGLEPKRVDRRTKTGASMARDTVVGLGPSEQAHGAVGGGDAVPLAQIVARPTPRKRGRPRGKPNAKADNPAQPPRPYDAPDVSFDTVGEEGGALVDIGDFEAFDELSEL